MMEPSDYFDCVAGDGLHTETILVTPDLAAAWLERNAINRDISAKHVQALVWEIKNGKWVLTHQGFAFNRIRQFIDGQHRATAIKLAGMAVPVRVTFNVDADYHAPIDTGKMRRVHDILKLSQREVSICNALLLLEARASSRGTAAKVNAVYAQHQQAIEWARKAFPPQRSVTSNLIAAHVYAYPVAPRKVEQFAQQFVSFLGIGDTAPAVVLRRYVERIRFASAARVDMSLATLRCLQAHCEGEPLNRLIVNDVGFDYFTARRVAKGL